MLPKIAAFSKFLVQPKIFLLASLSRRMLPSTAKNGSGLDVGFASESA